MKNYNEKRLLFAVFDRINLLMMARLCVFLFLCSQVNPAGAEPVESRKTDLYHSDAGTTGLFNDQQLTVRGIIKDAATGDPLPGVTILVKGTTIGSLSDINGRFTLTVPDKNAVLLFSFVGFTTQELPARFGAEMNVQMVLEVTQISEVVVVGYGVQKKESVVGAITQVNNEALVKSGITSVTNAITGKLSGVLTIQQTGEPGANQSEIIVRGLSSWNSSAPLVLVDGVERDFKDLDPNEINTISVLKDASATAVFGARGANGVIIVTTKRGALGKAKMDFSSSYGVEQATQLPEHISSYQTMSMLNVALMNQQQFTDLISQDILEEYRNPSTPIKSLQYPDVDWFRLLANNFAPTANLNLNIHGGTNFMKYFFSLGYLHENSFFKAYKNGYDDTRYWYNRLNYRTNVDFTLTKSTQLSLNLGGDLGIKNQPSNTTWTGLYGTSPSRFPAYFPAWVLEEIPDPDYPDASGIRLVEPFYENFGNPYSKAYQGSFSRSTASTLFTDLILEQKLDSVLEGLSAKGKVSLSTYYVNTSLQGSYTFPMYRLNYDNIGVAGVNPWYRADQGQELYTQPKLDISVGGMGGGFYTDLYYEASLNYANTFGQHRVTGLALMNRQQKNSGTDFPYYNEGLVGRATYDYARKYLFEVNIGYTGSERFAPGNRFGFFPSGAIGWVISEEDFFKTAVPWINRLKIRYSDGLVGSDYAANRWLYISQFSRDPNGNILEDSGANTEAQWEEARKRDIGIELGINNVFTINVDLFDEFRDKMLLSPLSATFVVGSYFKDLNLGSLKKHGIEIEAEYNKTFNNNFNFFVKGMFGFNENRIINKDDPPYAPDYTKAAGKPVGSKTNGILLTEKGYFTSVNDIHNHISPISVEQLFTGEYKFVDYNADGAINASDKFPVKGNSYPPITCSLSSGFSYKGFDFHFLFNGNVGKWVVYNMFYQYEFNYGSWRVQKAQLNYWRPDNQDAEHSNLHYTGDNPAITAWAGGNSSAIGFDIALPGQYWRNADYLRLKEVYLGYTFNSSFLKNIIGVSNMMVYFTGNNLWTLTNLIEGDPERKDFMSGFYPQMKTYKIGARFSF
jgi:TonB-linked SusC/RagA family outer membrane protein